MGETKVHWQEIIPSVEGFARKGRWYCFWGEVRELDIMQPYMGQDSASPATQGQAVQVGMWLWGAWGPLLESLLSWWTQKPDCLLMEFREWGTGGEKRCAVNESSR